MEKSRSSAVISILVVLVVILGLIVIYTFLVKPALSGYVISAQNQGVNYAVSTILTQLQQQGYVQIPVGNQTVTLIPPQMCSQLQQQSGQVQATTAPAK